MRRGLLPANLASFGSGGAVNMREGFCLIGGVSHVESQGFPAELTKVDQYRWFVHVVTRDKDSVAVAHWGTLLRVADN
jgi:hypothetical protein